MDYNNPESNLGGNNEAQTNGEYHSSETYSYGTYSDPQPNGAPDMNYDMNRNMNYYTQPQKEGTDVLAIISLVMGILSLLCCCMGFGILFGIVGIILAGISIATRGAKGIAIGGLVTSIIGTLFSLIMIGYMVFSYNAFMKNPSIYEEILEELQEGTYDDGNVYGLDDDWMNELY